MAPRYLLPNTLATRMEVGPSAAPMMAMAPASLRSKPQARATISVKKMPNCAAAPKSSSRGLDRSGPKSIIAPIPMNSKSGNSSLAMPALNSVSSTSVALERGRFTRIAPKPMGKSSVGSMSFLMAR